MNASLILLSAMNATTVLINDHFNGVYFLLVVVLIHFKSTFNSNTLFQTIFTLIEQ